MFKNLRKSKETQVTNNKIIIKDISTDLIPITGSNQFAIILHNLLSPEECTNLIKRAESYGYDDALIQGPGGKEILRSDIRSCGRCIIDDEIFANDLYARILNALEKRPDLVHKIMHAPWITSSTSKLNRSTSLSSATASMILNDNEPQTVIAVGLNERMRFLKYQPGHFFRPHQDNRFVRGPDAGSKAGEISYTTVQLYLNDKFKGGTTRFLCGKRYYDVKPKVRSVLIFDHDILHEGSKVVGGTKYSVRTDIMFRATSSTADDREESEKQQQKQQQRRVTSSVASLTESDPLGIFSTVPQAM